MPQRELFGGAITIELPLGFIDASDIRQVPDNQEVYLSPDSEVSIMLEILEAVNADDGGDAAKFHFEALADDNSAISQKILDISLPLAPHAQSPPATPAPTILSGEQEARKYNKIATDRVMILMALYRIKSKKIDIILTINIPMVNENQQSKDEIFEAHKQIFYAAAKSMNIVDFGLFA